jgi:cell wall-associated NlpC family hydrolase
VRSGRRGAGLDCSNFAGFVFSYALGIDLPTGVVAQAEPHRSVAEGALAFSPVGVVHATDFDTFTAQLEPADIVYIRSDAAVVSHAVLWLGDCGVGPNATPLVLDAGGTGRTDFDRTPIPAGVRIRPYRRTGWYARNTAHAHRIVPE